MSLLWHHGVDEGAWQEPPLTKTKDYQVIRKEKKITIQVCRLTFQRSPPITYISIEYLSQDVAIIKLSKDPF